MRAGFRKMMVVVSVVVLVAPMLSGCSVWRNLRETLGYQDPPPPIVEDHQAPCQQPHRGSPHRDCSGTMTTYTERPAGRKQVF